MISGALLLPRDYSKGVGRFLKHNWLQLLITTEIWLFIMFWYLQLAPNSVLHTEGLGQCLLRFVMTLLFLDPITMGNMWYMPMILCLYLMIPILSEALKRIPEKYFVLPMALVLICSFVIPDLNSLLSGLGFSAQISTTLQSEHLFSMFAVYLLLGYFLSRGLLKTMQNGAVMAAATGTFLLTCVFQYYLFSTSCDAIVYYSSFLLLASSIFCFELIRRGKYKESAGVHTARYLSEISFGIYFVHICIMEGLEMVMNHYVKGIHYLPRFFILEFVSFFGAILIIQLFRRNTWIAKNMFGIKKRSAPVTNT